jgi:glutamate--cysteine ligase
MPVRSDGGEPPLTRDDLTAYLRSGCKPREAWRVGVEHEKLVFVVSEGAPPRRASFSEIGRLLDGIDAAEPGRWERIHEEEGGPCVGLSAADGCGCTITLEPGGASGCERRRAPAPCSTAARGSLRLAHPTLLLPRSKPSPTGQLELSGTPSARLHDVVSEVERHVRTVKAVGRQQGLRLLALGLDPVTAEWPEALRPPRPHHRLMAAAIAPGGTGPGADILYGSASVQVSLDFSDERDMRAKMSVASALQPIATALLANSPFSGGAPSGLRSARAAAWERLPLPERAGLLEFVMSPDFSFEAWADWAARLPVLWLARGGRLVAAEGGGTFDDFLAGRLPAAAGRRPVLQDWKNHLGSLWPDVRLKRLIEMRGADAAPWRLASSLPAFWTGLLYDDAALSAAGALVRDWTALDRQALRRTAARSALRAPFRGGLARDVAAAAVDLARGGLVRRGMREEALLSPLEVAADTGLCPADLLLEAFGGRWGGRLAPMFEEVLY